jgi:hypothetical protein
VTVKIDDLNDLEGKEEEKEEGESNGALKNHERSGGARRDGDL